MTMFAGNKTVLKGKEWMSKKLEQQRKRKNAEQQQNQSETSVPPNSESPPEGKRTIQMLMKKYGKDVEKLDNITVDLSSTDCPYL